MQRDVLSSGQFVDVRAERFQRDVPLTPGRPATAGPD
jgi:hypothetical protein